MAEIVRRQLQLPALPKKVYQRLSKATDWLYVLVQDNGDAPNLGANDGTKLLPIGQSDYRDFRPTVQLASTLFNGHTPLSTYFSKVLVYLVFKISVKTIKILNSIKIKGLR